MWYVGKFDEATWQLFNAIGLSPSYLRQVSRGMAAVDQHISYYKELHAGAVVTITSKVLEIKEKSIRFVHDMINDDTKEISATTVIKGVHIDTNLRKSCEFEATVIEKAKILLELV